VTRRGGRAAEGAALEMPCTGNRTVGSNPTPSATFQQPELEVVTLSVGEKGSAARRRPALIDDRRRMAVLDGEVAVPCNPQSAIAGLNSLSRAGRVE
jgi:hypothetical protein